MSERLVVARKKCPADLSTDFSTDLSTDFAMEFSRKAGS
jgi:hypothetical protein